MAKAAKKNRIIQIDMSGQEDGIGGSFHIPEGNYRLKVDSVEEDTSKAGNDQLKWIWIGVEDKAKGKKFWWYTVLPPRDARALKHTLIRLGVEVPDSVMDLDLDDLVGREAVAIIEDDEYEGRVRSKINSFMEVDENTETTADERKPSASSKANGKPQVKLSRKEVEEMAPDELEELNDKFELGVELDSYPTNKRKRLAVIAGLEERKMLSA
jgi:hypothetical protein